MPCVKFSELDGATIGVWGAGREIQAFAAQVERRLPAARIAVVVSDDGSAALPGARPATDAAALAGCDVLVRSPGVSIYRLALDIPVTTATALWMAERGGRDVIGVTGTKGKSTTASLIAHLAGIELAGNIGRPVIELLDVDGPVVCELSSYQTADLEVGPEVAVVTNLYPEHLDWHGSHERYRRDKLRILGLPGVRTTVVGPGLEGMLHFGTPDGWHSSGDAVARGATVLRELPLPGAHNALNLCAALTALDAAGLPYDLDALKTFAPLPHRLETVHERDGVTWVDDSISTTPESALAALASFPGRHVVLIGGGSDRGQDYAALGAALVARGADVIGLPVTGERLVAAAGGTLVEDLAAAVALAGELARAGTVVLLSPAAPSYNRYRDFEERGDHFRVLSGQAMR